MDTRKVILIFMYSERIKSELIIGSELLSTMINLEGKERIGAEKMMSSFFKSLTGEIRIAQGIERSLNFIGAEKKIMEALGKINLSEFSEIDQCISQALSLITTSCLKAMEVLEDKQLI